MAVPLGLVSRLEDFAADKIEVVGGNLVTQYRGRLMPLIPITQGLQSGPRRPVLVFTDRGRSVGLIADEIIDVVEERLAIELIADRPGVLGVAVIAGRATDVIDTGYWLTRAYQDWFGTRVAGRGTQPHVLVVDDDDFFRQLLVPALAAAGYGVTASPGGQQALRLREAGEHFDVIISDLEMPDMDGLEFARRVRDGGAWKDQPLIALTGREERDDGRNARAAGFTDHVLKFDREALLVTLKRHLALPFAA
jgi:two-component system chemotaxis sensor kinase CheA